MTTARARRSACNKVSLRRCVRVWRTRWAARALGLLHAPSPHPPLTHPSRSGRAFRPSLRARELVALPRPSFPPFLLRGHGPCLTLRHRHDAAVHMLTRGPVPRCSSASSLSTTTSTTSGTTTASTSTTLPSKLDPAADSPAPRSQASNPAASAHAVFRDDFFPEWKADAAPGDLESPEELQKKDPLGIQIWKLYSKTKSSMPNGQRMDNLSWRLMSMNLKRQEQERARYAFAALYLHASPPIIREWLLTLLLSTTDCYRKETSSPPTHLRSAPSPSCDGSRINMAPRPHLPSS